MKDTSLEEKIKNLVFWTIIFFVIYLLVAYLLNSLWLKNTIKFKDIYDIFKDGLTITAAFLAPASAFLLFSNWREQYNAQFIDKTLIDLIIQLKDMEILLNRKEYNKNDNLFDNIRRSTYEIRFELKHTKTVLKIYPKYINTNFIEHIDKFEKISKEIDDLIDILSDKRKYQKDSEYFEYRSSKEQKLQELSDIKTTLENKITDIRLILLNKT
ncbi:hypothetical protein [Acinetobacter seifertii]|uniref:hypothetical protein n=1 Tax=Acinetobacter seifertii TaxID=1530123 RepID=UPI001C0BB8D5|nr:hypothetical protein [Acinetobacter seifertii]MBU3083155.1 hypothetical protein [Acinetobacter seifertii]